MRRGVPSSCLAPHPGSSSRVFVLGLHRGSRTGGPERECKRGPPRGRPGAAERGREGALAPRPSARAAGGRARGVRAARQPGATASPVVAPRPTPPELRFRPPREPRGGPHRRRSPADGPCRRPLLAIPCGRSQPTIPSRRSHSTAPADTPADGPCRRPLPAIPCGRSQPTIPSRRSQSTVPADTPCRHPLPTPPSGDPLRTAPADGPLPTQPVDRAPRMGIRPRRDGEPRRPAGGGALSPPDGGPHRLRDPFRPLSRGGRTLPAPLPGGASRRVGARGTFSAA